MTAVQAAAQGTAERSYMLNAHAESTTFAKNIAPYFVNKLLPGLVNKTIGDKVEADGMERIRKWARVDARNISLHLTSAAVRKAFKNQFKKKIHCGRVTS